MSIGGLLVFLDRDGVLTEPVLRPGAKPEAALHPADVSLCSGAAEGLRTLRRIGATTVLVSNQPGAAKGETSLASLLAVHERLTAHLEDEGLRLDAHYYCFHHPEAVDVTLLGPCACRKPNVGLLEEAVQALYHGGRPESVWMVGDTDADVEAGGAFGARTVLIEHPLSAHRRSAHVTPDYRADSLQEAAILISQSDQTL